MKTGDQITYQGRHGRFIRELPNGMAEIVMGSQQVKMTDIKLFTSEEPSSPPPKPALHPLVGKSFMVKGQRVRCAHVAGEIATVMKGKDSWDVPTKDLGDPVAVKPPAPAPRKRTTKVESTVSEK